jgi:hypothetical protein
MADTGLLFDINHCKHHMDLSPTVIVYEHIPTRKLVAVKELLHTTTSSDRDSELSRELAQILSLSHPTLATL